MEQKNQPPEERRGPARRELDEIRLRLDQGDERFAINEASVAEIKASLAVNTEATQKIAQNTAGLVRLTTELEAGTRFLCRCALGVRFVLKDVIEPYWKMALFVFIVIYYITHDHQFPTWMDAFAKAIAG